MAGKRKIEIVLKDDESARELYKESSNKIKLLLEENYGKEFFLGNLRDRVNSYEDVCKELGRKVLTIKDFSYLPEEQRERALNLHYIENITKLYNEGNINNYYYPYFRKSGLVWVVFSFYFDISSCRFVGSGFYYKDSNTALYCANKFIEIYRKTLD